MEEYHQLFIEHDIPLWFASGSPTEAETEGQSWPALASRIVMISPHGHWRDPPPAGGQDTGGQTHYVLDASKCWARMGRLVLILARWFEPYSRVDRIEEGCWLVRLRAGGSEFVRKEEIYKLAPALAESATAVCALFDAQVVLGHYADGVAVAAEVAERLGLPLVSVPHSLGVLKMLRLGMTPGDHRQLRDPRFHFWIRESFELAGLRAANFCITSSPTEADAVEEHYRIHFPMAVIPEGVSREFFDVGGQPPSPQALGRCGLVQGRFLIFWGRIIESEHIEGIVAVLGELRRLAPDETAELQVVVAGGWVGAYSVEEAQVERAIRDEIERYGLSEWDVVRLENLNLLELAEVARGALAFVGTQRFEPFGVSAAQAMALGLPVLISAKAGIAHWLEHGRQALLIDAEDPAATAREVLALLRDPERRDELGRAGCGMAAETFCWEVTGARQLRILDRLVARVDPREGEVERPAEREHFTRRTGRAFHRMTPYWRGDFPRILAPMVHAAAELLPEIERRVGAAAERGERLVVAIGGESGSGKSEIAHLLNLMLRERGSERHWGIVLPGDAFFVRSPTDNYEHRIKAAERGALHEVIGPQEVDLARLDAILARARAREVTEIHVPSYSRTKLAPDRFYNDVPASLFKVDVVFVDLTYSLLLENVTCKVFLEASALDRIAEVRGRNLHRDPEQDFDFVTDVLELEHELIAALAARADLVVDKQYHLRRPTASGDLGTST